MKLDPAQLFYTYMRGWSDGAGIRPYRFCFVQRSAKRFEEEYDRGYKDGKVAYRAASEKASKRVKYKPLIVTTT